MKRSSIVAGVYVFVVAVLVFLCIQETKFASLHHNFGQALVLRILVSMLILAMAFAVNLYMAYWQLVRKSRIVRGMLKFLFFPALLIYAVSILDGSNQSSIVLIALLFLLFADPVLLFERAALNLAQSIRKNREDDQSFLSGSPTESAQLYALDFFIFAVAILLIMPRLIG